MPKPTVLLTLGRLPKALALVRACHAAGCRVLVADPFRWHLCRPSRDVDRCFRVSAPNDPNGDYIGDLLRIVDEEKVDIVLPVSEEALHVVRVADALPPGVRLWTARREQLGLLHDKLSFVERVNELGLAAPASAAGGSAEATAIAAAQDFVVKPRHSCSGIGLRLARAGEPLGELDARSIVQARVDGDHLSSLSLVHDGREIVTIVYRGRVFAGTVAICFERVDDAGVVEDWVSAFLRDSDYSGFIAFDFIVDANGRAQAIECNPRVTSGVHFLDAAALGQALLDPASCTGVPHAEAVRQQWAYSTLTETYASLLRPREFLRRFGELRRARDVVWSARDPMPFLLMTPMSWEILWPAMTSKLTLGEATQRDIAWFGGSP
ncbi:MAG: ATP-grasp domain-containing protein [Halieaceae bacterium]|jgi:predicted ATP-grasp superfamily ATP-dependent carboligase|nr:ATP-grasp domain-containing protein [Halieaceae bacterium]